MHKPEIKLQNSKSENDSGMMLTFTIGSLETRDTLLCSESSFPKAALQSVLKVSAPLSTTTLGNQVANP